MGDGHLILPTANTYTDRTEILDGWITAQNDRSLGTMNPTHAPTLRPYTTISDGAALHLKTVPAHRGPEPRPQLRASTAASPTTSAGPTITPNGGTLNATNYTFGPDQGLSLTVRWPTPATTRSR